MSENGKCPIQGISGRAAAGRTSRAGIAAAIRGAIAAAIAALAAGVAYRAVVALVAELP